MKSSSLGLAPPPDGVAPRGRRLRAAALAGLALAAASAWAQAGSEAEPSWHVSGFGSVGLVSQSGDQPAWRLARDFTQEGAGSKLSGAVDTRAGLQLNWALNPQLDGALQVVARPRLPNAKASESLEWAYATWRPTHELNVRLGRASPDIFLFADSRSVGVALPWVRPPVDFYGWMPWVSMDGVDASYQRQFDGVNWRARLAAGRFESSTASPWTGDEVSTSGRDTLALSLTRDAENLLLKASYVLTRTAISEVPMHAQLEAGLNQLRPLPLPQLQATLDQMSADMALSARAEYVALGLQWEPRPWLLHAEVSKVRLGRIAASGQRGYVSVGRRFGLVTPYVMASRVLPARAATQVQPLGDMLLPVVGPALAQQAQMLAYGAAQAANISRMDQSTLSLGLRWDVSPRVAVKAQYDRVKVHAQGAGMWRWGGPQPGRVNVATLVVDFTWGQ